MRRSIGALAPGDCRRRRRPADGGDLPLVRRAARPRPRAADRSRAHRDTAHRGDAVAARDAGRAAGSGPVRAHRPHAAVAGRRVVDLAGELAEHLTTADAVRRHDAGVIAAVDALPKVPAAAATWSGPGARPRRAARAGRGVRRGEGAARRPRLRRPGGPGRTDHRGGAGGRGARAVALRPGHPGRVPGHRRRAATLAQRDLRRPRGDGGRRPQPGDLRLARSVGRQPVAVRRALLPGCAGDGDAADDQFPLRWKDSGCRERCCAPRCRRRLPPPGDRRCPSMPAHAGGRQRAGG